MQEIINEYQEGASVAALARKFKKSPNTISKLVKEAGVKRQSRTIERVPSPAFREFCRMLWYLKRHTM